MKNRSVFILATLNLLAILTIAGCGSNSGNDQYRPDPYTTIMTFNKTPKQATPEEKKALQDKLQAAADKQDYAAFADLLRQVYNNGWETEKDFQKVESDLYVKGTKYFDDGQITDKAWPMANTIYGKVFESWRFKYLRIECLAKQGNDAFDKGDLVTAKNYATQIMQMEFRAEGVNLMAKINIKEAEAAIKAGDKDKARQILNTAAQMQIDQKLLDQINNLLKGL